MQDFKQELLKVDQFFQKNSLENRLSASEEFLHMFISSINDDSTEFLDRLYQKISDPSLNFDAFINDYTIEVGALMMSVVEKFSQVMMKGENAQEEMHLFLESLSEVIFKDIRGNKKLFLQEMLTLLNKEKEFLAKSTIFKDEAKETLNMLVEKSQIAKITLKDISNFNDKQLKILIILLIQECNSLIMLFQMQAVLSDNVPDFITEDEYDDEEFDFREKISEIVNDEDAQDIYNPEEFRYSITDKPICAICEREFTTSGLQRHLSSCIKKNIVDEQEKNSLYYLKISDRYDDSYYLHILVSSSARLFHLDRFLRDIWLECCGHMSSFIAKRDEIDMGEPIDILNHHKRLSYTYDYGSSTELVIEFKKEIKATQDNLIQVIARNPEHHVKCHCCNKKSAKYICSECNYTDEFLLCEKCVGKHCDTYHDGDTYPILNFVNSPRVGVCGYGDCNL